MTYQITYGDDATAQVDVVANRRPQPTAINAAPARGFALPSIAKTALIFAAGGGAFFGAEVYAPVAFRPSTVVGTYDARVTAAVKAAELTQQARYESWANQVKLGVEQRAEQFKAFNNAVIARYQATWDRTKIYADATAKIQTQYAAMRMAQTQQAQSTDTGIVNLARLWGRVANTIQPGAGDSALEYARSLSGELSGELTDAATNGVTISVDGWDTGLATVADLQRDLAAIKPVSIPAPPTIPSAPVEAGR